MARAAAQHDLISYAELSDTRYHTEPVHCHIAEKLMAVADGRIKRLIITIAPQHGKSRLTVLEFGTWMMGRKPPIQIAHTSYSADQALKMGRLARNRIVSACYQHLFPATRLSPWETRAQHWGTSAGGFFRSVGVGGTITGFPADLLLVDDPLKDLQEAHSPARREFVWEWFWSTAYPRLSKDGAIVVIMTRWHPDDLVGRLTDPQRVEELRLAGIDEERWEVVNLPAIAEEKDAIGRQPGEALAPHRFPIKRLLGIRASTISYLWSSQYQGKPTAKGGNFVSASSFTVVEAVPDNLLWVRFWDLASTERESADFTASVAMAVDSNGMFWVRDLVNIHLSWPHARSLLLERAASEPWVKVVGVEAVGGFKAAFSDLASAWAAETMLVEVDVESDKLCRALGWMVLVDNRKFCVLRGPMVKEFFAQAERFPKGDHDDMVDAVSGAHRLLRSLPTVPRRKAVDERTHDLSNRRTRRLLV